MDKARQSHVDEICRLADAIRRTDSPHLRRDYTKAFNRMRRELAEYDRYMAEGKKWQS